MNETREQEINEFIQENQPLLDDPTTGEHTLSRIVTQSSQLCETLSEEAMEAADRAADAADSLAEGIRRVDIKGTVLDWREREHNILLAEFERYQELSKRLEDFCYRAGERLKQATDNPEMKEWTAPDRREPLEERPLEEERPHYRGPAWVGLVALAMVCGTILLIAYWIFT